MSLLFGVFRDRYKSIIVQNDGVYLGSLIDYIHLNPVRAGLVDIGRGLRLLDYPWSSLARGYALPAKKRPQWLRVEAGLAGHGQRDEAAGRRRYVERLEEKVRSEGDLHCGHPLETGETDARRSHLRRGWYWGSQEFAEGLMKTVEQRVEGKRSRSLRGAAAVADHGERSARRLLEEGLKAAGLDPEQLATVRSTDPRKASLAHLLWTKTTVSQKWIAEALKLKSAPNTGMIIRSYQALNKRSTSAHHCQQP